MFTFSLKLQLIASIINHLARCVSTASWQSNMQASKDLYLAFGEKHSRLHFPSSQYLSEALSHQLDVVSREIENDNEERSKIEHPFMSCTSYLHYDAVILSLVQQIGENFPSHISYTSADDDRICFVVFVKDTTTLLTFTRSLKLKELFLFVPVPDILKVDHSILHAIDWMSGKASQISGNSSRNLRSHSADALQKHPILDDILKGLPIELSVIFRPSWSSKSQEKSVSSWFKKLLRKERSDGRVLLEKMAHWDNFVWTSKKSSRRYDKKTRSSSHHHRHLEESEDFFPIYERFKNLPPSYDNSDKVSISVSTLFKSGEKESNQNHEKWEALHQKFLSLHSDKYLNGKSNVKDATKDGIDVCDYSSISIVHRKNNILLKLGTNFLQSSDRSAACLANIIVLISGDKGVTRVALSRPMHTLNDIARPIMQSGNANKELYSIAGLDGKGVVVGISDTGIDEYSCYFKDPKGMVPRSGPLNPHIDHSFRKVIQYINYSGSGGDSRSGHGSHVAGTIAGYSLGTGNTYRGMASGAKIAFFDIGAKNGDLIVPTDLSTYVFPPAYAAGARLHSNSWGGGYWYDAFCIELDTYLYDHIDFLVFFAAGNNGGEGYGTVLSPGLSKNSVAVAASYTSSAHMTEIAFFSSIGPAPDGRNKPDITAPGYSITSANAEEEGTNRDSCRTASKAGTSMATPVSAGTAALMTQYFQDENYWLALCNPNYFLCKNGTFTPKGPTIKALFMHSGAAMTVYQGLGGVGRVLLKLKPDVFQGYGRVNLFNILPLTNYTVSPYTLFIDEAVLTPLSEYTYTVYVNSTLQPLIVTLSWFDPPNPEFAARVLVHDLDILLIGPNNTVYNGNSQDSNKNIRDELNNVRESIMN